MHQCKQRSQLWFSGHVSVAGTRGLRTEEVFRADPCCLDLDVSHMTTEDVQRSSEAGMQAMQPGTGGIPQDTPQVSRAALWTEDALPPASSAAAVTASHTHHLAQASQHQQLGFMSIPRQMQKLRLRCGKRQSPQDTGSFPRRETHRPRDLP